MVIRTFGVIGICSIAVYHGRYGPVNRIPVFRQADAGRKAVTHTSGNIGCRRTQIGTKFGNTVSSKT